VKEIRSPLQNCASLSINLLEARSSLYPRRIAVGNGTKLVRVQFDMTAERIADLDRLMEMATYGVGEISLTMPSRYLSGQSQKAAAGAASLQLPSVRKKAVMR